MSVFLEVMWHMTKETLKLPAAVAAYLALAGVILGTLLAVGTFPPLFGGFARTTMVSEIAMENNVHWAYEVQDSLLRMDQAKCAAPTDSGVRRMYDQLIQEREQEYASLTHQPYRLPRCRDL